MLHVQENAFREQDIAHTRDLTQRQPRPGLPGFASAALGGIFSQSHCGKRAICAEISVEFRDICGIERRSRRRQKREDLFGDLFWAQPFRRAEMEGITAAAGMAAIRSLWVAPKQ